MQLERVRVERLLVVGFTFAENEDVARNYREELARVRGGYKADGQQLTDDAAALAYRILGDSEETTASVDSVRRALNEWSLDVYGKTLMTLVLLSM